MKIDWDVEIAVSDGSVVRADIFRPDGDGPFPVLMSHGPYAKGLHFREGFPMQWKGLTSDFPEVLRGSSGRYANWETVDPERWVPFGYVCVRVDSRGAGRSPGVLDCWSLREIDDFCECIEWAANQPWSNGKIGLAGVSYYASTQWQVAARRPKHLAAICPFEGYTDMYRDACRHGGILNTFLMKWYPNQIANVQNGLGSRARVNPNTGVSIAGPDDLSDEELLANRVDIPAKLLEAELITDSYYKERTPDLAAIEVPVLSCGNWGGHGVHLRGNVQGWLGAGSKQKWMEFHGREHWTEFYTDYGVALQKRFFDHFLKGENNGWDKEAPIRMLVRHVDRFVQRTEQEWPLARTLWTRSYLDAASFRLTSEPSRVEGQARFDGLDGKASFSTAPFEQETEVTGPVAATLYVSTTAKDADLFLTVRAYDTAGKEHLIVAASEFNAPLAQGWLRASHRKLDPVRSKPWQPVLVHDELQYLEPGEIYELQVEIWPMSFVFPKGWRLVLTVGSSDFQHDLPGPWPEIYGKPLRGSSVLLHDHPEDRTPERFGGEITIHTGGAHPSFLLLPVVPAKP
ncbi:CocE/NonD family hydrolase [Variovorax ureilyticus]|uniref:CocE/NonD family hydrolase n=1 Tax=Variovorax ureilyticus TaxID=1836198 RepID=A0ABU8VRE9_9BURK